jgi:hypothetical protein
MKLLEYFAHENPNVRIMFIHPGLMATAMSEKATKDLPKSAFTLELDDCKFACSFPRPYFKKGTRRKKERKKERKKAYEKCSGVAGFIYSMGF